MQQQQQQQHQQSNQQQVQHQAQHQAQQQVQNQQMQQMHMQAQAAGGMGGGVVRPPPPEYKAAQAQLMHGIGGMGQQPRFPGAGGVRGRVTQQPMPPSGKCRNLLIKFFKYFFKSNRNFRTNSSNVFLYTVKLLKKFNVNLIIFIFYFILFFFLN